MSSIKDLINGLNDRQRKQQTKIVALRTEVERLTQERDEARSECEKTHASLLSTLDLSAENFARAIAAEGRAEVSERKVDDLDRAHTATNLELTKAIACAESAERKVERLREALKPFAEFADAWDKQPLRGIDDSMYSLHGTTHFKLSDCKRARAALAETEKE